MALGSDHPAVAEYLGRLEAAAGVLPAGRREELVVEIRGHLQEALSAGPGDEPAVRGVLDRLGTPEDIVAAEQDAAPPGGREAGRGAPVPPGTSGYPPGLPALPAHPPGQPGPAGCWTPVEVGAVLALTVGAFVLPVIGPLLGLVLVWMSARWAVRDKVIATVLAGLQAVAVVIALLGVLLSAPALWVGSSSSGVVSVPAEVAPSPLQAPLPTPLPTPVPSPVPTP